MPTLLDSPTISLPELVVHGTDTVLPLLDIKLDLNKSGPAVSAALTQTFTNPTSSSQIVDYVFTLPARAAVCKVTAKLGTRLLTAVVKERAEARNDYQEAVASGNFALLVEEDRADTYTMSLGNLAAGQTVTVTLELNLLPVDVFGVREIRFPLALSPRYTAGDPQSFSHGQGLSPDTNLVPDASRVTPSLVSDRTAEVTVTSDDALSVASATVKDPGKFVVACNRDLVLTYQAPTQAKLTAQLAKDSVKDSPDGATHSVLVEVTSPRTTGTSPRDVVVVFDRSGSMGFGSWKEVTSQKMTVDLMSSLNPDDRLAVMAFDTSLDWWNNRNKLTPATSSAISSASTFIKSAHPRGGTNLQYALEAAANAFDPESPNQKVLLVVTDAQITAEDHLLRLLEGSLSGVRLILVGVDLAFNMSLASKLEDNFAAEVVVLDSPERGQELTESLQNRLGTVAFEIEDLTISGATVVSKPRRLPRAFADSPSRFFLRVKDVKESTNLSLRLARPSTSTSSGSSKTLKTTVVKPSTKVAKRAVQYAALRFYLRHLEDAYTVAPFTDKTGLEKSLVDLSCHHQVLCRFTAFVLVDDKGEAVADAAQPVTLPASGVMAMDSVGSLGMVSRGSSKDTMLRANNLSSASPASVRRAKGLTSRSTGFNSSSSSLADSSGSWSSTSAPNYASPSPAAAFPSSGSVPMPQPWKSVPLTSLSEIVDTLLSGSFDRAVVLEALSKVVEPGFESEILRLTELVTSYTFGPTPQDMVTLCLDLKLRLGKTDVFWKS